MPLVLLFPEIAEAPNSDGTRFQPKPETNGTKILGCPAFPSQGEAAYFNICLYKLLGYGEPAYASRVQQYIRDEPRYPERAARRKVVEDTAAAFVKTQKLEARPAVQPVSPPPATPAAAVTEGQQQEPVVAGRGKRGK